MFRALQHTPATFPSEPPSHDGLVIEKLIATTDRVMRSQPDEQHEAFCRYSSCSEVK